MRVLPRRGAQVMIALLTIGALLTSVLTPTTAATAALPTKSAASHSLAMRKALAKLQMAGASDAQIKAKLGLVRVSTSRAIRRMSASSVTLSTPAIYYDNLAHYYYVTAGWTFNSMPDGAKCPGGLGPHNCTVSVGGNDGFGLAFSNDVNNIGGSLYICPDGIYTTFKCYYANNYATNSAAGAGWLFQDKYAYYGLGGDYSAHKGSVVFAYKPLSAGCLQVFTSYTHTWSSTRATGVSVSVPLSITIEVSSTSNEWPRASSSGKIGC